MEVIDSESTKIETPVQAEKFYLPKLIAGEIDLSGIRKELRDLHYFSEEDIKIAARVIGNAHLKYVEENPGRYNQIVPVVIGGVLATGGVAFAVMLWNKGWIATLPFAIFGIGITTLFRAFSKNSVH